MRSNESLRIQALYIASSVFLASRNRQRGPVTFRILSWPILAPRNIVKAQLAVCTIVVDEDQTGSSQDSISGNGADGYTQAT